MIVFKVINQRVVRVALANHQQQLASTLLATRNGRKFPSHVVARCLVQSAPLNQKTTNANHQQLISIARNISFRQCQRTDLNKRSSSRETSAKASFSISTASPTSHFISADSLDSPFIVVGEENAAGESPLETLKRKTKDIRDKRELIAKSKYYGQSFNEAIASTSERRLVVLLSWLEAKEKHIEKYRQFYLDRGFDVLNVKTSPLDLLLPNIGARKISEDFVRFMIEKQYSNVVIHGFSVGGYMFGRLLLEIDRQEEKARERLLESFKGLVFDSLVPFEGTCVGVANSITSNKPLAKSIELLIRLYLYLGHNIATKHFLEVSDKVWGGPLKCPSLFLMSKDDFIADHKIIERLQAGWRDLGLKTESMTVDKSPHVQIFSKHHDKYVKKVGEFLKGIQMV